MPEEIFANLTKYDMTELSIKWEEIDEAQKEKFRTKYGDITSLILVVIKTKVNVSWDVHLYGLRATFSM